MSLLNRTNPVASFILSTLVLIGSITLISLRAQASGNQTPAVPGTAEIRISSEIAPPGGTAQVKFSFTEPRPILSSGSLMAIGGMLVDGVAVWSSTGNAGGLGVLKDGVLTLSTVDPTGVLGANVDYPFLTVTMDLPSTLPMGSLLPLDWTEAWLASATVPLSLLVKPGGVKVAAGINIRNVSPGGGTYPAGTVIRISGSGFSALTKLQTPVKYSSLSVSPNEMLVTLQEQTTMDAQSFQVSNPDRSSDTYFAYLRGTLIHPPSRAMLNSVEPAFPAAAHAIASLVPWSTPQPGQFVAMAFQNPTLGPAVVTLQVTSQGVVQSAYVILPAATRVVDDLSALLGGLQLRNGDIVQITSTSPVQMLGIAGDENTGKATPFLPVF